MNTTSVYMLNFIKENSSNEIKQALASKSQYTFGKNKVSAPKVTTKDVLGIINQDSSSLAVFEKLKKSFLSKVDKAESLDVKNMSKYAEQFEAKLIQQHELIEKIVDMGFFVNEAESDTYKGLFKPVKTKSGFNLTSVNLETDIEDCGFDIKKVINDENFFQEEYNKRSRIINSKYSREGGLRNYLSAIDKEIENIESKKFMLKLSKKLQTKLKTLKSEREIALISKKALDELDRINSLAKNLTDEQKVLLVSFERVNQEIKKLSQTVEQTYICFNYVQDYKNKTASLSVSSINSFFSMILKKSLEDLSIKDKEILVNAVQKGVDSKIANSECVEQNDKQSKISFDDKFIADLVLVKPTQKILEAVLEQSQRKVVEQRKNSLSVDLDSDIFNLTA